MPVHTGTSGLAIEGTVKDESGVPVVLDHPDYFLEVRLVKADGTTRIFTNVPPKTPGGSTFRVLTLPGDIAKKGRYVLQAVLTTPVGVYPTNNFEFIVVQSKT